MGQSGNAILMLTGLIPLLLVLRLSEVRVYWGVALGLKPLLVLTGFYAALEAPRFTVVLAAVEMTATQSTAEGQR